MSTGQSASVTRPGFIGCLIALLALAACERNDRAPSNPITGVGNPTVTVRVEGVVTRAVDGAGLDSIEVVLETFLGGVRRQTLTDSVGAYALVVSVPEQCGSVYLTVSPRNDDGWASQFRLYPCAAQTLTANWSLEPGP